MKVLISGGAGYIGSTVANYLLDKNYKVTIIDNLSKGYKFLLPKKATFIKTDISNKIKISKLLQKEKFDYLIHLAALSNVEESVFNPKKYLINNFEKSKIFFDTCMKYGLNKIIFSSTAAVYKNSLNGFVSETSKIQPLSPYGKSKFHFESYLKKQKKINYIVLRYFNVAGCDYRFRSGPIHQKSLFKNLVRVLTGGDKILKVHGTKYKTKDGSAVRDFIHVQDLARIHFSAGKYLMKHKKNIVLNCGYGKGTSVLDVIKVAKNNFSKKLNIEFVEKRKGDLPKVVAMNDLIKKKLKWKPKFNDLNLILEHSVKWEKKLKKIYAK